jgi:DNA-binding NarL/FixJ family response regulator
MDGISVIREINRQSKGVKILALTMHRDEEFILEAFRAGAHGYCLKTSSSKEVIIAIRSVLSGKQYVSPEISAKVLDGYLESKKFIKRKSSWELLTQREKEILKLVGEGYRNKDISDYLFISVKTVEKHRSNIMEKLDLHSASALTAYAIEKGLVSK